MSFAPSDVAAFISGREGTFVEELARCSEGQLILCNEADSCCKGFPAENETFKNDFSEELKAASKGVFAQGAQTGGWMLLPPQSIADWKFARMLGDAESALSLLKSHGRLFEGSFLLVPAKEAEYFKYYEKNSALCCFDSDKSISVLSLPPGYSVKAESDLVLLEYEGNPAGYVKIIYKWLNFREAYIEIYPKYRGRGLGKYLLAKAAAYFASFGQVITYTVEADNIPSLKTVINAGFKNTALLYSYSFKFASF